MGYRPATDVRRHGPVPKAAALSMDEYVQRQVRQNINPAGLGIRNIRSGAATVAVYVRFVNLTDVDVDVIWINEEGRGIRYGQLKKMQYLDISTYEGHPWIFRESGVGDLLIGQPGRMSASIPMLEPPPLLGIAAGESFEQDREQQMEQ
ncbi:unnamed protein product [Heligmosomoides polygyrus]|uniref:VHL domain-containing protein n=1 Tax=Heligmosomoides polygyrus TaxID=6339 RepID=A0A3P8AP34_HELPZ|nr:unnamed protein product [Heligmosomoides polygyrus]